MLIRVLVVDDDPEMGALNARMVERVPGYTVAEVVTDGASALKRLSRGGVDLMMLDMRMPGLSGLEVLRRAAAARMVVPTIIVSSVRDMDQVSEALLLGVVHYLLKPFTFSALRAKLEEYSTFMQATQATDEVVSQHEVDALLGALRVAPEVPLPKTLAPDTLREVANCLKAATEALSAEELGRRVGLARVSARRYADYLVERGQTVRTSQRSGQAGRPLLLYSWRRHPA